MRHRSRHSARAESVSEAAEFCTLRYALQQHHSDSGAKYITCAVLCTMSLRIADCEAAFVQRILSGA